MASKYKGLELTCAPFESADETTLTCVGLFAKFQMEATQNRRPTWARKQEKETRLADMRFFIADYKCRDGRSAWREFAVQKLFAFLNQETQEQLIVDSIRRWVEDEGGKVASIYEVIGAQSLKEAAAYASDLNFRADSGCSDRCIYLNNQLAAQYVIEVLNGDFT